MSVRVGSFATLVFKTLKSAHQLLGGKETDEMVAALKDNFVEYHALYEEKRLKWKEVPAEVVAEVIYKDLIDKSGPVRPQQPSPPHSLRSHSSSGVAQFKPEISYRIVDFGCGIDGLFEHKLADLVAQRDGKGCVHTLAVDVGDVGLGEQSWPKVLTKAGEKPRNGIDDDHTTFQCESIAGDYTKDIMYNTKLNSGYFDAGVFCLAIMAADGLSRALLVASKIVKPEGPIFIVLDTWKFGFHGYVSCPLRLITTCTCTCTCICHMHMHMHITHAHAHAHFDAARRLISASGISRRRQRN